MKDVFDLAGRPFANNRPGTRLEAQTGDSPVASLSSFPTTVVSMGVQDHPNSPRLLSIHVGKLGSNSNDEKGACVSHSTGMIGIVQVGSRRFEEVSCRAEDISLLWI